MQKRILILAVVLFPLLIIAQEGSIQFEKHIIESDANKFGGYSAIVDLDNDGDMDLITTSFSENQLVWHNNDGNQIFTKQIITDQYAGIFAFGVVDINSDGHSDFWAQVTGTDEFVILINDGNQNFNKATIPGLVGYNWAEIIDFDGDLDLDIRLFSDTEVIWLENTGNLNFVSHTIPAIDLANYTIVYEGDFTNDGKQDFLVVDKITNASKWYENVDNQSFTLQNAVFSFDANTDFLYPTKVDIAGDGNRDLVSFSTTTNELHWHENDGNQNFIKYTISSNLNFPDESLIADVDNDGDIDIMVHISTDKKVLWFENDGNQTFTEHLIASNTDGNPIQYSLGDIDSDNDIDIFSGGFNSKAVLWLENNLISKNIDDYAYTTPILGNYNYIYIINPQKAVTSLSDIEINKDVIESVTYFDGLGRPMQSVAIRAGGKGEDLITPVEYDGFGRQVKDYLPFAKASNSGEKFHATIMDDLEPFYQVKYASDFTSAVNPYSEKVFENSPLNRVLKQGAPGSSWEVDNGSDTDHSIKFNYQTNESLSVKLFEVTFLDPQDTETPSLTESDYYNPNELYKTVIKNENWQPNQTNGNDHTTEEFKDKQERIVLKRTYNENAKHDTYYIYDDYNNLTYVIPPKASDLMLIDQTILDELCYQYKYDYRDRLIEKKIPGKGMEFIVYDNLDRPVLTQDANLKATDEWLFMKYDVFGRIIYTGKYIDIRMRSEIQETDFNNKTTTQNYEEKLTNGATSNLGIEYTNTSFPTTNLEVLTIKYYDNYDFAGVPFDPAINPVQVFDKTTTALTKSLATGVKVKVLDTSNWITTISYYDNEARSIYIYSNNTFLNTIDIVISELDFVGKVLRTRTSHAINNEPEIVTVDTFAYDQAGRLLKQVQCIGDATLDNDCGIYGAEGLDSTVVTTETVNPGTSKAIEATISIVLKSGFQAKPITGQTVEIQIKTAGDTSGNQIQLIAENTYDELGQLERKNVGNKESAPLQNIDYTYNVRGWLKKINQDTHNDNDLFNFTLMYNDIADTTKKLYNGNISQTSWNTLSDNPSGNLISSEYIYTYDALNRITSAIDDTGNYSLNDVTYDKMGNIQSLSRNGWQNNGTFMNKDVLIYNYHNNEVSNKLQKVSDSGNTTYGFKDGANLAIEYAYDVNANLISDTNKGITSILYNHLNLPTEIKFNNSNTQKINYTYDADGTKLRKVTNDNGNITTYDYASNGTVYENNVLQFTPTAEGYVMPVSGGNWRYVFQHKDHINNVRLSYSDGNGNGTISQSEIIEENNYQPFGLKMKGFNNNVGSLGNGVAQRYKFGGKEFSEELNLNTFDFGARNYDPALGRWMNIDPLAEQMRRHSPYNYAFDSPIYFIDPDGMEPFGSCCGGIFTRAVTNPSVQKFAKKAIESVKKIFSASVKVKPKIGIGISGKAKVGPIEGEINANVITVSADAKLKDNKLSANINAKVLTGSAKLKVGDKSVKASATLLKASIEATVDDELNVNVQDSSVEKPTADFTMTNGNNKASLNTDNDFTIGASVKLAKAVEVGASINLTSFGDAFINSINMIGSFVEALGTETIEESKKVMKEGLEIPQ